MFEYAKDHGYIASNPFPELKVTVKFRQVSKPTSETQVYNTDEYHNIIEDLWKSYDKKHEPRFLSIVCNFLMGLRAGELCALRWRDLDMKKWEISIVQEMVHMNAAELRKTYASRLNAAGLPHDQIRACLGHSNTATTLGYIYNPLTPEENLSIMEKAFAS